MRERLILWALTLFGITTAIYRISRPPVRDWVFVFLTKSTISSFVGQLVVQKKLLKYPVRLMQDYFQSSFLFEYILFPLTCVVYNQVTMHDRWGAALRKLLYFSIPMTLVEAWLERNTRLVKYKTWRPFYTFASESIFFIIVRALYQTVCRTSGKADE